MKHRCTECGGDHPWWDCTQNANDRTQNENVPSPTFILKGKDWPGKSLKQNG